MSNRIKDKTPIAVAVAGDKIYVDGAAGVRALDADHIEAAVTKVAGVAAGATANSSDATLLNRANHTGTQAENTITNLVGDLAAKIPTSYLDTDVTLAANSDTKIATQAAVKAYVAANMGGGGGGGGGASRQTFNNSTGDTTLTAIAASIIQHVAVGTITGAAGTRNVAVPTTNRTAGDRAVVKLLMPATDGIVLNIRNATTGGTILFTITTDDTGDDGAFEIEYDGSAWQPLRYDYPIN